MATGLAGLSVARKKTAESEKPEPKRYGTMMRVSDEFAEAIRKLCSLSGQSAAEYTAERLMPLVLEDYDKALAKEVEARKKTGK